MAERTYVPLQPWSCEKCGRRGEVEMPAGTDAWQGLARIQNAHGEASPACHDEWGANYVRVKQTAPLPD